jgi:hypothetical protein
MRQYLKYLQFTPFKPHADMHNAFKVYSNEPSSFFARRAPSTTAHMQRVDAAIDRVARRQLRKFIIKRTALLSQMHVEKV